MSTRALIGIVHALLTPGILTTSSNPGTWTVHIEARVGSTVIDGLRRFGHDVRVAADHDDAMGHAHAIEVLDGDGYRAGSDARTEGRAITR